MMVSDLHMLIERSDFAERESAPQPSSLYITNDVKRALDTMLQLKNSSTAHEYVSNICELNNLADRDDALICMEDYKPQRYVLECLSRFQDDVAVAKVAFEYLLKLCRLSGQMRNSIQSSLFLMNCILDSCEKCVSACCKDVDSHFFMLTLDLLSSVMIQGPHALHFSKNRILCDYFKNALINSSQPRIIVSCAHLLAILPVEEFALDEYVAKNVEKIMDVIKSHINSGHITSSVSSFISHVLNIAEVHAVDFVGQDIHRYLIKAVDRISVAYQIGPILTCLANLFPNTKLEQDLNNVDFHRSLTNTALKFRENGEVQTAVLRILTHMGHMLLTESSCEEEIYWIKIIARNMRTHPLVMQLNEACCKALTCLCEYKSRGVDRIGDDRNNNEIPVHIMVLGILYLYTSEAAADLLCAAMNAIYWLAMESNALQVTFMTRNAHLSILDVMQNFPSSSKIYACGTRALRGLTMFSQEYKTVFSKDGIMECMRLAWTQYEDDEQAVVETITTITSLADLDVIRHQFFLEYVNNKGWDINYFMTKYSTYATIQEACLESLCVLAAADGATAIMLKRGSFKSCLEAMATHPSAYGIQKNGLIFMQLLSSEFDPNDDQLIVQTVNQISKSMSLYPRALGVQAEGCVTIQLLAERSPIIAKRLVEAECPIRIFNILEDFNNRKDLHSLAAECLYVLLTERHLKSMMLLQATKYGQLKTMKCLLLLGADPNFNLNSETPLICAIQNNDDYIAYCMLQSLLEKGAKELPTALELTMNANKPRLTGLILKYLGCTKDGTVCWCDLRLPFFKMDWFDSALNDEDTNRVVMEVKIKQLVRKINQSKDLRVERRLTCPNVLVNRLPLRYRLEMKRFSLPENNVITKAHTLKMKPRPTEWRSDNESDASSGRLSQNKHFDSPATIPHRGIKRHYSMVDVHQPQQQGCRPLIPENPRLLKKKRKSLLPWRRSNMSIPRYRITSSDSGASSADDLRRHSDGGPLDEELEDEKFSGNQSRVNFSHLNGEIDEWMKTTLSGANIPFSLNDPRRRGSDLQFVEFDSQTTSLDTKIIAKTLRRKSLIPKKFSVTNEDEAACDYVEMMLTSGWQHPPTVDRIENGFSSPQVIRERPSLLRSETTDNGSDRILQCPYRIRILDLSCNNLTDVDDLSNLANDSPFVVSFLSVTRLSLSYNRLKTIPTDIWKWMPKLEHLELNQNKLTMLPYELFLDCRLAYLDASNNQITDIPLPNDKHFRVFFQMKTLKLSYNAFSVFPNDLLSCLPGLEILSLQGNKLRELPQELHLRRLKELNLANNYFQTVPDNLFKDTTNLEVLDLSSNEIETLPHETVSERLCHLGILKLSNNQISGKEPTSIPQFILYLTGLQGLDLSANQLTGIPPPNLWSARNIRELKFGRNSIETLDLSGIKRWSSTLETFDVSYNLLKTIPKEIGKLSSLTQLNISYNSDVTTIPDELGNLPKNCNISLMGLNLNMDEALIKGHPRDLISYLHKKLKRSVPYYGLKLMLVGYEARGKTSLLRALRREKIMQTENVSTVGINVYKWKYPCRVESKAVEFNFVCWDFAGQEEFYATHQCFLTQRALYLVVYDLRKKEDELSYLEPWLLNIKAQAPGCPVIVVGTHVDQIPKSERAAWITGMQDAILKMCSRVGFPRIQAFATVDARRDNSSVDDLRQIMERVLEGYQIKGERVMGQTVPESYVRLEELVQGVLTQLPLEMPILRHNHLLKIVKDAKLGLDEEDLKHAVRFLHEAGVMLHFEDTTLQLQDFYFVDPQWLCRMMAQVVTVRDVNPFIESGVLKHQYLELIFTGKRIKEADRYYIFPKQHIPKYLKLLEKFEVCLPQNDHEILIPCRLPIKKPEIEEGNIIEDIAVVRRFYEMTYLPTGFWARLIARLHAFLDKLLWDRDPHRSAQSDSPAVFRMWRRGFYAYWSSDRYFLIEGNYESKRDSIRMQVPRTKAGCSLLAQIVDHVDVLIEEWYSGLLLRTVSGEQLMQKWVPCISCNDVGRLEPHNFDFDDIILQAQLDESIVCPLHDNAPHHPPSVPLHWLAPDVVLSDFDAKFALEQDKFQLVQTPEYLIGRGGFGSVYRATYRNVSCAVKIFISRGIELPAYRLVRQEVSILVRLQHPSLIKLLAIHRHMLLLELAPMGSLDTLLHQKRIRSRTLQHRISIQIAEGLNFLHKNSIIYRDLKLENILVFSLSVDRSPINVKLSDYGISRLLTPYGLMLSEGTVGYRAPEILRGQMYSIPADVYSFAIVLYGIISDGEHPFEGSAFRVRLDDEILRGRKAVPKLGSSQSWPKMYNLINQCLEWRPADRPTAREILKKLRSIDFLTLRYVKLVDRDSEVGLISVRGGQNVEVVSVTGTEKIQIAWSNIIERRSQGVHIKDQNALTILNYHHFYLFGTKGGRLWLYNAKENKATSVNHEPVKDSILSLCLYRPNYSEEYVLAGLANGSIVLFQRQAIMRGEVTTPIYIETGIERNPIRNATSCENKAIITCGSKLLIIQRSTGGTDQVELILDLDIDPSDEPKSVKRSRKWHNNLIRCLLVRGRTIFISRWGDTRVFCFNFHGQQQNEVPDIRQLIKNFDSTVPSRACRITALAVWDNNRFMAVGCGGGFIVIIDRHQNAHVVLHPHTGAITGINRIMVNRKAVLKSVEVGKQSLTVPQHAPYRNKLRSMSPEHYLVDSDDEMDDQDELPKSCLVASGHGLNGDENLQDEASVYITVWQDDMLEQHFALQLERLKRRGL